MLLTGSAFSVASFKHKEATAYGIRYHMPPGSSYHLKYCSILSAGFFSPHIILHANSTIVVKYVVFSKFLKCRLVIFAS